MSLSSWFRDYLYIPLGGNKAGTMKTVRNIFIVFIVCGFWHGANWTFLVWGAINAIFMLPSLILYSNRKEIEIVAKGKYLPTFKELLAICLTFILVMFGWIFFRAENLGHATHYISQIFSSSIFTIPVVMPKVLFILLVVFIVIEWWGREQSYAIANIGMLFPRAISWLFYYMIIFAVFYFAGAEQQFIYFQF
jgi:D-alanyl-lipoteichoic acid acyltransferase DltB (MBOAT superfamily)